MKLSLLILLAILSVTISDDYEKLSKSRGRKYKDNEKDKDEDGPLVEPQDPECRKICKGHGHEKVCGEQDPPPKNGNSTVTLYNNACELVCDRAQLLDMKICEYEKRKNGGPLLQPQDPTCRTTCKKEGRTKVCGEQRTPPKNGNRTVTLYNNQCEVVCDRAQEILIKICKYEEPKERD